MQVAESSWQARAACRGMDPALWFPERGDGNNQGHKGKEICAACPVVVECLEHHLTVREKHGIAGGASQRRRRVLLVAFLQRAHDFDPRCTNTSCRWCPVVREHLADLNGETEGPVVLNGPNALCGRRSTYARGCRCGPCCFAITTIGVRFDYAGYDIPSWWAETFGDATGDELVDMAKWYAEKLLERAA